MLAVPSKSHSVDETLTLINGMMQHYASSGDAVAGLRWALPRVLKRVSAAAGSLFLVVDEAMLECVVCCGPVNVTGLLLPSDKGLVGRAFTQGRAELVADACHDAVHNRQSDVDNGFRTISTATAPVMLGQQRFGALQVINRIDETGQTYFNEADLSLLETLATTLALAISNVQLAEKAISDGLVARDLEQARVVQQAFAPTPDPLGNIAGQVLPAGQLSGDFFDYLRVDGRIAFCQGDVAGKGIAAALTMARVTVLFRQFARQSFSCVDIICGINDALMTHESTSFVTFVVGWLAPDTGKVELANCGHGPVIMCRDDGMPCQFAAQTVPLGVLPSGMLDVDPVSIDLGEGFLYLATDGVTEACSHGQELGVGGLVALVRRLTGTCGDRLASMMSLFTSGKLSTHDDATFLVLAGKGAR